MNTSLMQHFNFDSSAIASGTGFQQYITITQRKVRYSDKDRMRWEQLRKMALAKCKCSSTAEIKRRLKILGVSLDLRLSSAWRAIIWNLAKFVAALAIAPGAKVVWQNAPAYFETHWAEPTVCSVSGTQVMLEMWYAPVSIFELNVA